MRRVVGYLAGCFTIGLLAPLAFATGARASTVRVVHPGESIQAAVDASGPGDTVVVQSGTYAQSVGIHTSGITLIGRGAKLVPPPSRTGMDCVERGVVSDGICILPPADEKNPPAGGATTLDGVTVAGMTVTGFPGSGIFAIDETHLTYVHNTAIDNGEYGVAAFQTVDTQMLQNTATGSGEADVYLGDSPNANGLIRGNIAHRGNLGILIRNSQFLTVQDNDVRNNCVGMLVLADNPGPAGNLLARHNTFLANTRSCPAAEGPPVSGIGVALAGAHDVQLQSNVISGNQPSGPTPFSGGVVLASLGPTPPTNNLISHNTITNNSTDVFSDGTDVGTTVRFNTCAGNAGLCK